MTKLFNIICCLIMQYANVRSIHALLYFLFVTLFSPASVAVALADGSSFFSEDSEASFFTCFPLSACSR